jgi:hypothetical protein
MMKVVGDYGHWVVGDEAESTRDALLLTDSSLDPLLDRLEVLLKRRTARPLDRQLLRSVISEVLLVYRGSRYWSDEVKRRSLHEIAEPLAKVISLLKHGPNGADVAIALGAPTMMGLSPDQEALAGALKRQEILLHDLETLARAVPKPPPPRERKRPIETESLRALVDRLASYWEQATGHTFTQSWLSKSAQAQQSFRNPATTDAAAFVYDVVAYIDPARLSALPNVTKEIVTQRRAAASR